MPIEKDALALAAETNDFLAGSEPDTGGGRKAWPYEGQSRMFESALTALEVSLGGFRRKNGGEIPGLRWRLKFHTTEEDGTETTWSSNFNTIPIGVPVSSLEGFGQGKNGANKGDAFRAAKAASMLQGVFQTLLGTTQDDMEAGVAVIDEMIEGHNGGLPVLVKTDFSNAQYPEVYISKALA